MTEILPCPFCGKQPYSQDNPEEGYGRILCLNAECDFGHRKGDGYVFVARDTLEETIAAWNSRPSEEALRKRIAELENIVPYLTGEKDVVVHIPPHREYTVTN